MKALKFVYAHTKNLNGYYRAAYFKNIPFRFWLKYLPDLWAMYSIYRFLLKTQKELGKSKITVGE